MHFNISILGVAALVLAGCGGTSVEFVPDTAFNDRLDRANANYDALVKLSPTRQDNMPATGSAAFQGQAAVAVYLGMTSVDPTYLMLGDSRLNANFASGKLTGRIDNLEAIKPFRKTAIGTESVKGNIVIGGKTSNIGDAAATRVVEPANVFTADFATKLVFDNQTLTATGDVAGAFVGNRVKAAGKPPMKGLNGTGFGAGRLSGGVARVGFDVFATQ